MRMRTVMGLGFAGFFAAAAVAVGGAAYAGGDGEATPALHLVIDDAQTRTATQYQESRTSTEQWNCPEKDGAGPGESGASTTPAQPTTPPQPAAPQESL